MEKERTPEKTNEVKPDEQNQAEPQAADTPSAEPSPEMDIEPEIEQTGSTPDPETEPGSENAPEPESETTTAPEPAPADMTAAQLTEPDPLNKTLAYGGFFLLLLVIVLVGASLINSAKYYVIERDGAVEIWKGRFSPAAKEQLIVMPGVQPPSEKKDLYAKEDVYPTIFKYYLDKSDALLDVPGLPDFAGIKGYLTKALSYATTESEVRIANERIDSIELTVLLYKADRSIGNGTREGLRAAEAYLGLASELNPDSITAGLIQQKLESVQRLKAALNAEASIAAEKSQEQTPAPAESTQEGPGAAAEDTQSGVESTPAEEQPGETEGDPPATPEQPATEKQPGEQSF